MIRQLGHGDTTTFSTDLTNTPSVETTASGVTAAGTPISRPHFPPPRAATPAARFADWGEVRSALPTMTTAVATMPLAAANLGKIARVDAALPSVTRPHFLDVEKDDVVPEDLNGNVASVIVR